MFENLDFIRLAGPNKAVEIFGVRLVGMNAENGKKLLFSLVFLAVVLLFVWVLRRLSRRALRGRNERLRFWGRQTVSLFAAVIGFLGLGSIWFNDPGTLATVIGLVTAGLALALQRVVVSVAAYFVILRGKTFNVGDRIVLGNVRGDVIAVRFTQTIIMEMGQPPAVQSDNPAMWVRSRQYTGRIVSVSNARIFEEPVYNYTRDFPFLWEELTLPIRYEDDRNLVEKILLDAAHRHTIDIRTLGEPILREMERRYFMQAADLQPKVYCHITDNWLEVTVRFIATDHGVRDLKDRMTREILDALDEAGITIASATFDVVGLPPLRLGKTES